ncbi:MAG: pantetheine-phosphate adenylyltransferase [Candidatus Hydrogenedentota bacterium]
MAEQRIAVYPGSFDPPTLGHRDLIERASRLFDKVVIGVARNIGKSALFSRDERMAMLEKMVEHLPSVEVGCFQTLTVEFAHRHGACAIIRGLRVLSDFEFELTLAINNRKLDHDVDTVCLMPAEPYAFLSSSMVKEIAAFGGDFSSTVTPDVAEKLKAKMANW